MIQCTYCGKEIDNTIGKCYCDKTQWEQSQEPRHVDAFVMCQLFLGNYGYPLKEYVELSIEKPPELPKWAFEFVDKNLKDNISRMTRINWAKGQLKILADMLEDRDQGFFAKELRTIVEKIGT